MREILTEDRRLSAIELCDRLQGMCCRIRTEFLPELK